MVSDEERVRRFVRELLPQADLSTLTLGILKGRYLQHIGGVSLTPEQQKILKQVVKAELLNMQNNQSESERSESAATGKSPHTHTQLKRKRDDEEEEEKEIIPMAKMKKSRLDKSPDIQKKKQKKGKRTFSSEEEEEESEEENGQKERKFKKKGMKLAQAEEKERGMKPSDIEEEKPDIQSEEEDSDEEQKTAKKEIQKKKQKKGKTAFSSEEEEEDMSEEEDLQKERTKKNTVVKSRQTEKRIGMMPRDMEEEKPSRDKSDIQSEEEEEEEESDEEEKPVTKEHDSEAGPDTAGVFPDESDSSSLPSLDDDEEEEKEGPKKKEGPKEKTTSDGKKQKQGKVTKESKAHTHTVSKESKEENKSVTRLKRYIALCGVRRNYKKLLDGCQSVRAQVAVLKNELEELGVQGKPSIDKCKRARLKREEAQELAELDMSNIITTEGRPRRRTAAAAGVCVSPPRQVSRRRVESDPDSDDLSNREPQRATDWSRLRGIISDEDSD